VEPLPEVVGITVHLTFAARAYELAAWFRAQGCTVVLGGLHALTRPDEVARHADAVAVAVGDGTRTWPRILRDVEAGRLAPRYHEPFRGYAAAPRPDRSVLPGWGFLTGASLVATQGCTNRCDFCYLATGEARIPYETRPPEDVAAELAATGAPYGVFIDNNLGASRGYLRALCRALAPLERIYKRSNWLWRYLVRLRLTRAAWAPLVELTRRRHVRFRARLARGQEPAQEGHPSTASGGSTFTGGTAG
jgi:radical SAM superfamily enzyme YgiQ (UPF0313 family)